MNTDNLSARRRQTRSTLVEAGMSVFAVKGIDGASIEEICEAAGFTRGAFYSNFSSRDDLVLATIEQRTSHDLDLLDAAIERWRDRLNSSQPEDIEGFLTEFIDDTFSQKRATAAEVIAEQEIQLYCLRTPDLYPRYAELSSFQIQRIQSLIENAIGFARAASTIPLKDLIEALTAVHTQSSLRAAAGRELHEVVEIDSTQMVRILSRLLDFSQKA
ncbi:TetR/AcrR family transcriptional regulator [Brevibacterium sp. RIT 803]|uniref:TetR/AcrR family transcriptional regulator n=1 Tax=Brevibacterium sp. RIT 803 TaxID=2810210 RepID=UPI0019526B9D|nr:TetR/AcrR family transcriptional regulator [Brevibacterium sp. RIT 803]MBM6589521.1 TetR/AcrR family transcriptional regulator [Brevibacterium sp. RIT 803]